MTLAICALTLYIFSANAGAMADAAPRIPFSPGERFTYDVTWMGILGGEASLSINDKTGSGGRLYSIDLLARSVGWVRSLYKVDDQSSSIFDVDNMRSNGVDIRISEGNYRKRKVIEFDHAKSVARYSVDGEEPKEYKIDPATFDSFSVMYAFRAMKDKIKVGQTLEIPVFDDRKKYELKIQAVRKERIRIRQGLVDTIVVEPQLKTEGIFQRRGKMTIWFSDDNAFAPVMMKSKIIFGAFYATLRDYSGARIDIVPEQAGEKGATAGTTPAEAGGKP
ncbi:MAG: DUF3108 domain-containing protein [Nitrospinae bacterium]|nr:DUF3108 domain-containing protein [Nitrospinota bacterium]